MLEKCRRSNLHLFSFPLRFMEPRVVIVSDPLIDAQAIRECARANITVIAFCNTDSPLRYVDVAIPCNNKGAESLGLMFWLLAREVKYLRGEVSRSEQWGIMPDMFIHRETTEPEKMEEGADAEEDAAEGAEAMEGDAAVTQEAGEWSTEW